MFGFVISHPLIRTIRHDGALPKGNVNKYG